MDNRVKEFLGIIELNFKAHLGDKIFFELENKNVLLQNVVNNEYISKLRIFGRLDLEVYLVASRIRLKEIIEKAFGVDFSEVEKEKLEADSLNEFLNLVIANSTESLSAANLSVEITPPKISSRSEITEKINTTDIFVSVNNDENKFYCIMVIKNMELE